MECEWNVIGLCNCPVGHERLKSYLYIKERLVIKSNDHLMTKAYKGVNGLLWCNFNEYFKECIFFYFFAKLYFEFFLNQKNYQFFFNQKFIKKNT